MNNGLNIDEINSICNFIDRVDTFDKTKRVTLNKTPIRVPVITCDFKKDSGVKIKIGEEFKPIYDYWFTAEFYNPTDYLTFVEKFKNNY